MYFNDLRDKLGKWAGAARDRARPTLARLTAAPWAKIGAKIGLWAGGALATLAVVFFLALAFADWNALKGPVARFASNATGREIAIDGDLDIQPFSWTPRASVEGLRIGNPQRFAEREQDFAEIAQARVRVRLLPLLLGDLDIVSMDVSGAKLALYRSAEGDANWNGDPRDDRGEPFDLPAIRNFSVRDGRLIYVDEKRDMQLDARFDTEESSEDETGEFALSGHGRINGRNFDLDFSGAPLINVRRDRPYVFIANLHAGDIHVQAEGSIARPFNLDAWQAQLSASGRNLADLYTVIGLTLPNTPPYRLRGHLVREDQVYRFEELRGRVGDSDVSGALSAARQSDDRLMLEGEIESARLDLDDLLTVLGAPPSTAQGETASPEQRAQAERLEAEGRVLPEATLDISRVRNMDARVRFHAAKVVSDRFPLRGMTIGIHLDHGLLRLDPLTLHLRQGRIDGSTAIDAREQGAPMVDLDVRLSGARMETLVAMDGAPPISGALVGRARLSGRGASVREAAANSSGDISFAIPSGEVREAFAELTGINVTRGLGLLFADDQGKIDIHCGLANFRVEDGLAHARSILIDTETMRIGGSGEISLRDETLDLSLRGQPKEPRLIRIGAPIDISGRWRAPEVGVAVEDALDQGGVAALFASILAPAAAVIPFLDPGLAEDADCSALLSGRPQPEDQQG